jgi:lactoylglutathione lyase
MKSGNLTNVLLLLVIGLFVIDFSWRLAPSLSSQVGHIIPAANSQESESAAATSAMMDYPPFSVEKGSKRLYHVGVRVEDIDKSIDFYVDKLGFQLIRTQDMGFLKLAFLWTGDGETQLELEQWRVEGESLPPVGGLTHLGMFVDDVDAVYEKLLAEGVEWEREPARFGPGAPSASFAHDPDGVRLEIMENPKSNCTSCHRGPHLN